MWLFTKYGMFSAVCGRSQAPTPKGGSGRPWKAPAVLRDVIVVRARVEDHLHRLKEAMSPLLSDAAITVTPNRDYLCRLVTTKVKWAEVVRRLAAEMDYDNFKSEVLRHQGHTTYETALHDVWAVMYEVQVAELGG